MMLMGKWSTGTKKVARKTYRVVRTFGSWLIIQGGKIIAAFIQGVIYTFSREFGKNLARRVFAAPVAR